MDKNSDELRPKSASECNDVEETSEASANPGPDIEVAETEQNHSRSDHDIAAPMPASEDTSSHNHDLPHNGMHQQQGDTAGGCSGSSDIAAGSSSGKSSGDYFPRGSYYRSEHGWRSYSGDSNSEDDSAGVSMPENSNAEGSFVNRGFDAEEFIGESSSNSKEKENTSAEGSHSETTHRVSCQADTADTGYYYTVDLNAEKPTLNINENGAQAIEVPVESELAVAGPSHMGTPGSRIFVTNAVLSIPINFLEYAELRFRRLALELLRALQRNSMDFRHCMLLMDVYAFGQIINSFLKDGGNVNEVFSYVISTLGVENEIPNLDEFEVVDLSLPISLERVNDKVCGAVVNDTREVGCMTDRFVVESDDDFSDDDGEEADEEADVEAGQDEGYDDIEEEQQIDDGDSGLDLNEEYSFENNEN